MDILFLIWAKTGTGKGKRDSQEKFAYRAKSHPASLSIYKTLIK